MVERAGTRSNMRVDCFHCIVVYNDILSQSKATSVESCNVVLTLYKNYVAYKPAVSISDDCGSWSVLYAVRITPMVRPLNMAPGLWPS